MRERGPRGFFTRREKPNTKFDPEVSSFMPSPELRGHLALSPRSKLVLNSRSVSQTAIHSSGKDRTLTVPSFPATANDNPSGLSARALIGEGRPETIPREEPAGRRQA